MIFPNPLNLKFFIDTIDSLRNEFRNDVSNNVVVTGVSDISRRFDVAWFRKKYGGKIIAFNQEPLLASQRDFMHPLFFKFLKEADEVWDYDERQVDIVKRVNPNTSLHILKPYKDWGVYGSVPKDIDILFYGAMNDHRKKVIDTLKFRYNLVVCNGLFGDELDAYIMRSKILLNVHYYYECAMQEQARMVRWLGSPCRIVSEKSWKNYLNVEELSYSELLSL